jgi:hypothetical protein
LKYNFKGFEQIIVGIDFVGEEKFLINEKILLDQEILDLMKNKGISFILHAGEYISNQSLNDPL